MELTVRKEMLVKSLFRSLSVVERRTSMPILSNVLLTAHNEKITITATDLESTFIGEYPANINKTGSITAPARKLYEIIRELPEKEIYLKTQDNSFLFISAGRATFNLAGLIADDYPVLPKYDALPTINLPGIIISEMIEKTIFSISQEETRFNLAGLYVQKYISNGSYYLRFVSTDGHRLSLIDKEIKELKTFTLEEGVIIPRKGIIEIRKLAEEGGELIFRLNRELAVIIKNEVRLILRILEGSFPNYDIVIPKTTKYKATINRQTFSEVLKRVSLMATDRFQGVHFNFKNNLLEIVSQNPELGEAHESLEINFEGEPINIGFNARYFLELCSAMKSQEIIISFLGEQSPCLIKGKDDLGFLSVIMPMRL